MNKASSVVEINGNRYDAASGKILSGVKKTAGQLKTSTAGVVDGFIRQTPSVKKPAVHRQANPVSQTLHQTAERSRTLMRTAVTKPIMKTGARSEHTKSSSHPSHTPIHKKSHATFVQRHKNVNRFGQIGLGHSTPTTHRGEVVAKASSASPAVLATPAKALTHAKGSQIEKLLDQALYANKRALSGNRPHQQEGMVGRIKSLPKWLSFGLMGFLLVVISGFLAWQNIPSVAVKVAAVRAGVNAKVPEYVPAGYSFSPPVNYSKGRVGIVYSTPSGKNYEIDQQASQIDSSSLSTTILGSQKKVQTAQIKGNTVYIYGESNDATWINDGIRYTIIDRAGLDSDQIANIAGSL